MKEAWEYYEEEEQALVDALNNMEITQKEFDEAMRDLRRQQREEAEYEADMARDAYLGRW